MDGEISFLKELAKKYIRLSQLDVKTLVTDIKSSRIFEDDSIFKAIQFNVAREVLDQQVVEHDLRFLPRGIYTFFDFKHFDLSIEVRNDSQEIFQNHQNCYLRIKRDKVCQSTDDSCLSAIMGEKLPLHGIHYWEFKVKAQPHLLRRSSDDQGGMPDNRNSQNHSEGSSEATITQADQTST